MSVLSVVCLCLVWTIVASQNISYDSVFCGAIGLPHSPAATKDKYKIMMCNLNEDRTLKAQKSRVVNFIINNWTNLTGEKAAVIDLIQAASAMLEKRWRTVAYLKGLLAKMKSKFDSAKFENIKKKLWSMDASAKQDVSKYYDQWILAAIKASPIINKNNVIADVVIAWEARNASGAFDNEFYAWRPSSDSQECF